MTWKQIDTGHTTAEADEGWALYQEVLEGKLSQSAAAKQLGIPRGTFIDRYNKWKAYENDKPEPFKMEVEYRPELTVIEAMKRRADELETENKVLKSLIVRAMRTA